MTTVSRVQPEQARAVLGDLKWAIQSPMLCGVAPPLFAEWAARSDALLGALSDDPGALPEELWLRRRTPIGRYFESLIGFWLALQPEASELKENLPIFEGKRTIGELDLVFQVGDTSYHWELAVKLYLGTGTCRQMQDWLGPLARDRLDVKMAKLFERQLRLPLRPQARDTLDALGIVQLQSHALVKGYLFHPFAQWQSGMTHAPAEVSAQHARGWWLRSDQASELAGLETPGFRFLQKESWLGPAKGDIAIRRADIVDWLAAYFDAEQRPPLLAAMDEEGREGHRGFVVPMDWGASSITELAPR